MKLKAYNIDNYSKPVPITLWFTDTHHVNQVSASLRRFRLERDKHNVRLVLHVCREVNGLGPFLDQNKWTVTRNIEW